jgi:hypothetical protein
MNEMDYLYQKAEQKIIEEIRKKIIDGIIEGKEFIPIPSHWVKNEKIEAVKTFLSEFDLVYNQDWECYAIKIKKV